MTTRVWHPGIAEDPLAGDGFAEVDDSAVPQLRQSGWLLATERDEHLERIAAHPSNQPPPGDEAAAGDSPKTSPGRSKAAGGKAGAAGEGS